jgi:hypothetical protein
MIHDQDLLRQSIEEFINRTTKRYGTLLNELRTTPPEQRYSHRRLIVEHRAHIAKLASLKHQLGSERKSATSVTTGREHVRWQYESRPERRAGAR